MISTARIYLFHIIYKGKTWISLIDANELSSIMARILSSSMPQFKFKNIQIINSLKSQIASSEVHINKIRYDNKKILTKDDIALLRKQLTANLTKIPHFLYDQIHVVNDEFSREPSVAFLGGESSLRGPDNG